MAVFAYSALNARREPINGLITADTPRAARQALRGQGFSIQQIRAAQAGGTFTAWLQTPIPPDALAELWRNLAMLTKAGTPLADALEICRRQAHPRLDRALRQLVEQVRSGLSFSAALATQPQLCDEVATAMFRVGEQSGTLDLALARVAEYLARRRAAAGELTSALIYPAILSVVGIGVVIFLMSAVIPQLVEVLDSAGRQLPLPTRILKAISDFIAARFIWLAAAIAFFIVAVGLLRRDLRGRAWLQGLALHIPVWGELQRKLWLARITGLLATMLEVEVRFTEALAIVRRHLPHQLFAGELQRFESGLERGANMKNALQESRLIPPLVSHLLSIGQESGELPAMLLQIRDHYEAELRLALRRFVAVLEPGLILVLAAIIGFVVYATLLPILETTKVVQ